MTENGCTLAASSCSGTSVSPPTAKAFTPALDVFLAAVTATFLESKQRSLPEEVLRERVRAHVRDYISTGDKGYCPFVRFCDGGYSRTHVMKNEHFELIVLCWKKGQASKIHNHAGSHCWMGVAQGPLSETLYGLEMSDGTVVSEAERPVQPGPCCPKLHEFRRTTYQTGEVAYASDKIGLHMISTLPKEGDAISLHLYAPPILVAKIYDPEKNEVWAKRMGGFLPCNDRTIVS